jgi:hypothetical protein
LDQHSFMTPFGFTSGHPHAYYECTPAGVRSVCLRARRTCRRQDFRWR